jgi:hypothetical protein
VVNHSDFQNKSIFFQRIVPDGNITFAKENHFSEDKMFSLPVLSGAIAENSNNFGLNGAVVAFHKEEKWRLTESILMESTPLPDFSYGSYIN